MVADDIAILCGVDQGGGCGGVGVPVQQCSGGTSAAAPLWAAMLALINKANGVGTDTSAMPMGFANSTLYGLAADFNDIADGTNNNWFDNGQLVETGSVPPVTGTQPSVALPFAISYDTSNDQVNSLLPGAAPPGTSEAAGLYHAVTGYDLVTGLGTPTCKLVYALAPSRVPQPFVMASGLPQLLDLAVDGTYVYLATGSGTNPSLTSSILTVAVHGTPGSPAVLASGASAANIAMDRRPTPMTRMSYFLGGRAGLHRSVQAELGLVRHRGDFYQRLRIRGHRDRRGGLGALRWEHVSSAERSIRSGGDACRCLFVGCSRRADAACIGNPADVDCGRRQQRILDRRAAGQQRQLGRLHHEGGKQRWNAGHARHAAVESGAQQRAVWHHGDAKKVYWTTTTFNTTSGTPATNTMTISQVPISGGAVTTLATSSSLSNPVSDGANVYFGDQATLSTVPVNGGTVTALATQQNVSKVAIDSTNVYWIDTGGGTLTRYPRLR